MLKRRTIIFMLSLISTVGCLCCCTDPHPVADPKPTTRPAVSEPASPTDRPEDTATPAPTSTNAPTATDGPTATSTPTPTPTATPTPSATPTPTPSPTPVPTVPPAPVALNIDTTTYDFIINRDYPLTVEYKPEDLVAPNIPFSFSDKTLDKRKLRKITADALEELYQAARNEEGLTIYGISGYRSYDRQYEIYGANLITQGIRHTNLYSAAPGNSEHQTGLAIDVSCKAVEYRLIERFATTAEGIWLKENCWRFGFILRYPKDKEHITGYAYEPWHIRYVGVPLAYYLYTNNLTLEEYYGVPSSHTLAELEDRPLIDMTTERFYLLYAATCAGEPYYLEDGSIWVSPVTGFPYLREKILNAEGEELLVNEAPLYHEPATGPDGSYVVDAEDNVCYTKPYYDEEGNLWLDYNGSPFYLQPLWNADGTLAYDKDGNLLYTEPVTDINGMVVITEDGSLTPKVPLRNGKGELTYYLDGSVAFYEPFINSVTGEYILDSVTGLPLYLSGYYNVPHNTLPIPTEKPEDEPEEEILPQGPTEDLLPTEPTEDPLPAEPAGESEPENPDNDTTNETGGFLG